jgi:hypothetical protein
MTSRGIDPPMSGLAHRAAEVVAAFHPPSSNLDLIALAIEILGLSRDDLEVVIPAADVRCAVRL